MAPKIITLHSKNNIFQRAEVLKRNREKRHRYQEFFVEGVRSINGAVKNSWEIKSFWYSPKRSLSDWAKKILKESRAEAHYELSESLLEELSDKEETSEIMAVVGTPADDLSRIPTRDDLTVLVLDRPANPGNLGSTIRSCDALGAHGVIITGHATDLYHPHTVRGSMGSLFSVPVIRLESHKEVLEWANKLKSKLKSLQIVGTSEDGTKTIDQHSFLSATLVIMGNETFGMSSAYSAACDFNVQIPMLGSASSLNVSCAASILLYEIQRQRRNG
jgi:23S rRNA (uridine2479-2'-O)-methyltransferase